MENSFIKKSFLCVILGISIGVFCKLFIIDIVRIQGTSMEPTFKTGDLAIVSKISYGIVKPFGDALICNWSTPKRGDIVIYLYKNNMVIKRCAAIPKDKLDYSFNLGYNLYIKDKEYPLSEEQYHKMKDIYIVPDDVILTIGDNAPNSIDSRNYGFVPTKNIIGRVLNK